jgi:DNA-binding transcriptional regulator PaaX
MTDTESTLRDAFLTTDPDLPQEITPLSWLRSMVDACDSDEAAAALGGDDRAAWFEMCREVRGLLDKASAALVPKAPEYTGVRG